MEALMNKAIKMVLSLTAMLAAGCSEGTVGPRAPSIKDSTIPGGGATAALTADDTLYFTFVIDPSRTVSYPLGAGNSIVFPAGSLCDPDHSTYGVGEWDHACPVASSPVTVQTKAWLDAQGFAHVDFSRHVRFVPTNDPAGWIMLSLDAYGADVNLWTKMVYCQTEQLSSCSDESIADPTLATLTNPVTGQLTRRVKHFSGYSLTSGRADDMDVSFSKVGTAAIGKP
jgi:hypothetical protein